MLLNQLYNYSQFKRSIHIHKSSTSTPLCHYNNYVVSEYKKDYV